jgi:hypothetical protein
MREEKRKIPFPFSSSRLIREELNRQSDEYSLANNSDQKGEIRTRFYSPLYQAWNVITYEHEESGEMHFAAHSLARFYKTAVARKQPRPEIIQFSDPLQLKILDALADAVGIPYRKGQTEIEIPEKLRDFKKWQQSGEYEAALAREKAKQRT